MGEERHTLKCVAIGDSGVGKTCLLLTYTTGKFPEEYIPTVFETYSTELPVNGNTVEFELHDTAGSEALDIIRPMAYNNADIFLIVYSVSDTASLDNVEKKWVPDIQNHHPNCPFVLAGNMIDRREESEDKDKFLTTADGQDMASRLKAASFHEASAKTKEGLKDVFDQIVTEAFNKVQEELGVDDDVVQTAYSRNQKKGRCNIL